MYQIWYEIGFGYPQSLELSDRYEAMSVWDALEEAGCRMLSDRP